MMGYLLYAFVVIVIAGVITILFCTFMGYLSSLVQETKKLREAAERIANVIAPKNTDNYDASFFAGPEKDEP